MHFVDLLIVGIPLVAVVLIAIATQKHMKSVADFMAASRAGGRYLVCNARGEAAFGAIGAVAIFELLYQAGFTMSWWNNMGIPIGLLLTLSGFCIYRYRETRVMTLGQFFEVRYSKYFRIFSGFTAFLSGTLNFGIFPAVSARFFVYFCGMPATIKLGGFQIETYVLIMVVLLAAILYLTLMGGQLTIMVTDCVEGMLSQVFYLVVAIALLCMFNWAQIAGALSAPPQGKSLLNPFESGHIADFNIWYILIGIFGTIYGYMSWQGGHAFNSSAANPHEAKMGLILGSWRGFARAVMVLLLGICAYTYLNHPDFAAQATAVQRELKAIGDPQIQTQMRVPVALAHLLPIGIKGMFCAIMLFACLAGDGSYLHSWGTVFVQDVVLPFRQKPFTPKQHIRLIRWAIAGVAIFAFLFGVFFRQSDYILMFMALTGAVYMGGAGAVFLGGLYWKKGTVAAAWTAMISGTLLAIVGILVGQYPYATVPMRITAPEAVRVEVSGQPAHKNGTVWEHDFKLMKKDDWQNAEVLVTGKDGVATSTVYYAFGAKRPDKTPIDVDRSFAPHVQVEPSNLTLISMPQGRVERFWVCIRAMNGQVKSFYGMLIPLALYVVVSLLTCKQPFNMDRMLHRGKYALETKMDETTKKRHWTWGMLMGIDKEFTFGDKIISGSVFVWSMFWFVVFVIGTSWNLIHRWPTSWWSNYWHVVSILLPLLVGIVTTIWFTWGGVHDLRQLFIDLRTKKRDARDDGTVVGHHNAEEETNDAAD